MEPLQPISTAPKDGTWIILFREIDDFLLESSFIIAAWLDPSKEGNFQWVWPVDECIDHNDVFTQKWIEKAMESIESGAYRTDDSFTHWMPLMVD